MQYTYVTVNIPLTYDKIKYSKTGAQTIKTAIQNWDGSIYFEWETKAMISNEGKEWILQPNVNNW